MLCKKCGFITRGIEASCPYCGTLFTEEKNLDTKVNFFGWFDITVRGLIRLLAVDLFALMMLADIIVFFSTGINLHLSFYGFTTIFALTMLVTDFMFPRNEHRFLFLKTISYFLVSAGILLLSYIGTENIFGTGLKPYQLVLGYVIPVAIIIEYLGGLIRFVMRKRFNLLVNLFYMGTLMFISALLFGLSYIPVFDYTATTPALILVYVSFIMSCLFLVNSAIIFVVKITSKSIREV